MARPAGGRGRTIGPTTGRGRPRPGRRSRRAPATTTTRRRPPTRAPRSSTTRVGPRWMRTAIQSASSPQAIVTPRNPYSRIEFHTTAYGQTHASVPAAQPSQRRPVVAPTTRPTTTAASADSSAAVTPIAHGLAGHPDDRRHQVRLDAAVLLAPVERPEVAGQDRLGHQAGDRPVAVDRRVGEQPQPQHQPVRPGQTDDHGRDRPHRGRGPHRRRCRCRRTRPRGRSATRCPYPKPTPLDPSSARATTPGGPAGLTDGADQPA